VHWFFSISKSERFEHFLFVSFFCTFIIADIFRLSRGFLKFFCKFYKFFLATYRKAFILKGIRLINFFKSKKKDEDFA